MKKFMVAVVMFVTVVMFMVMGPEEAFAKNSTNIPEPAARYAQKLMEDSTYMVNLHSEGEYTVISQEIVSAEDGEHYNWTVSVYNHELHQVETETVEIDIYDLVLTQTYISEYVEANR